MTLGIFWKTRATGMRIIKSFDSAGLLILDPSLKFDLGRREFKQFFSIKPLGQSDDKSAWAAQLSLPAQNKQAIGRYNFLACLAKG